ncbi:MAG: hypothetical protein HKN31_01720, partial [Pricia sp.]|nr:hypothetical protein [Pricia sp.]
MKKHIVFTVVITFALVACTGSKKITSTSAGSDTAMTSENQSTNSERRATIQAERTASTTENENENENEMTVLENTNGTS